MQVSAFTSVRDSSPAHRLVFSFVGHFEGVTRFAAEHNPSEPVVTCHTLPFERMDTSLRRRLTHREAEITTAAWAGPVEVACHGLRQ